jgi:hypothetical protein
MTKTVLTFIFVTFLVKLTGQNRLDSLVGDWHLQKYYSYLKNQDIESWTPNGCKDYLTLSINKKGKLKIIFTDHKDSIVFSGQVKSKSNRIKISNNIHEIIYLGSLEKCITPGLREDIRGTFYRTYNFSITGQSLTLYYNLPTNLADIKTMVLTRQ